jgi:RNAse (barnase) inhibitor barstar
MGVFRWPDDAGRLDFELLRESAAALYFSRGVLAEHTSWLRGHGYVVHDFDCTGWAGEEGFHNAVACDLRFPDYYGQNLAAFNDCLCSVDITEEGGLVLVFTGFDRWHATAPDCAWAVLDIIARWSRFFLLEGKRLLALVQSDDRGIRLPPVGAQPVLWNRSEQVAYARARVAEALGQESTEPPASA